MPAITMTSSPFSPEEHALLCAFARGETHLRNEAITVYDRALRQGAFQAFAHCAAVRFMSEVVAPVPDLMLRARYRQELLAERVLA